MTKLIEGKSIAYRIERSVKEEIETRGIRPGLAAVLVGDDPASHIYVRLKESAAARVGIYFERIHLPENTTQDELSEIISGLNNRSDIHAILLQLPLPAHMNEDDAIRTIATEKDVDGFHPSNEKIAPVLPSAIVELIRATNAELSGMKLLVVANNPKLLSAPLATMLCSDNISVENISPDDALLINKTRDCNILVVAVGRPRFILPEMIKAGAILIDVGINKTADGIVGDIDPACDSVCSYRSPVPGGIGPVTVATVMRNTVVCFNNK
ncbi:MAG: bifunctional 5,10-methylenetetrahydrofolate dehydrogenase/5,10-methenyltetrahydrofolate cyclohydrolase [Patescibacteria group bacterium]